MKKLTFIISPLIVGVLSGGFIQGCLCLSAIMISPFSGNGERGVLPYFGIIVFLLALLIIVALVLNIKYLVNSDSAKVGLIVTAQACVTVLLFFVSWAHSDLFFDILYDYFSGGLYI